LVIFSFILLIIYYCDSLLESCDRPANGSATGAPRQAAAAGEKKEETSDDRQPADEHCSGPDPPCGQGHTACIFRQARG